MDKRIQAITAETLTPLVRSTLSNPAAQVTSWQVEEVRGGWGGAVGGTAVYRVSGESLKGKSWSLILKILYERPGEEENSPYYWKREFELYRSRMLDLLPDVGLAPSSVVHLSEFPESCWMWLEDIKVEQREWSLGDFGSVARRLGRFNGAYLTGLSIPNYPWLSRNWHCQIVPPMAVTFARLDEYLENPLIQRTLPLSEKDTILRIWLDADRYIEALTSLPQVLCHIDAFPRNLFHNEERTILIDWALAGRGAIGEELTALVSLPLYLPGMPMSRAEALDKAIFEGYLKGLYEEGWTGDPGLVRLGYTCAMALRGLAGVKQDVTLLLDESNHSALLRGNEFDDIEEVADLYAAVRRFRLLRMADEARQLLADLG